MKKIVGLTGTTGAGKSIVAEFFKNHGAKIIDADKVARAVVKPGMKALEEIFLSFNNVVTVNGELDRKALADKVFKDSEKLKLLNSITHKYIMEDIEKEIEKSDGLIIIDAPQLYEAGAQKLCDLVLAVIAPKALRMDRIMKRDGLSYEQARDRMASQKTDEEFLKLANYTIVNDGDADSLNKKLEKILNVLGEVES